MANRERELAYTRAWRLANPEKLAAYDAANKDKWKRRMAEWRRANPDRARSTELRYLYGITVEGFNEILRVQRGRCANTACGVLLDKTDHQRLPHVDHDHSCCPGKRSCGKCIRGVICAKCNQAAGLAGDVPAVLRGLADYLEASSAPTSIRRR
jgi:hypothetical protein